MEIVPYSQASVDQRALEALNELVQHARKRGIEEEQAAKQMKENINGGDSGKPGSCLLIKNVADGATAEDIAKWLESLSMGGRVLSARLHAPTRDMRGSMHRGTGEVQFALHDAAPTILRQALPSHIGLHADDLRTLPAPANIGRSNCIKLKLDTRPIRRDKARGRLVSATKLQLGNLLGSGNRFEGLHEITAAVAVDIRGRVILFEFEADCQLFRAQLRLKEIAGGALLHADKDSGLAALIILMRMPLRLFRLEDKKNDKERSGTLRDMLNEEQDGAYERKENVLHYNIDDRDSWLRTVDSTPSNAFGRSFACRLVLDCPADDLAAGGARADLLERLRALRFLSSAVGACAVSTALPPGAHDPEHVVAGVPFMVRFYLECLLSQGLVSDSQLSASLFRLLLPACTPPSVSIAALALILTGRRRVPDLEAALLQRRGPLLQQLQHGCSIERHVPEVCMLVARVLVTPTRVVALAPEVELSNRVWRAYRKHSEHFLRVSFCDENGKRLCYASQKERLSDFYERMRNKLRDGLVLAGRQYELLAFSSGQVREQAAWFWSAPRGGPSAADIRADMGDFKHIRCIAKYTARMGQCFSSTADITRLQAYVVREIPDVERNGFCFSDGVGKISYDLGEVVARRLWKLGRCPEGYVPSAFQIRFAGCKGMVSIDPSLCGNRFEFRPSMNKFEAAASLLEVCEVAKYAPGYLNRQIITLLGDRCLGVPDAAFKRLQDAMVQDLNRMRTDEAAAVKVLQQYGGAEGTVMKEAKAMIKAGFRVDREPYLKSILLCIRAHLLQDLRAKTRIHVPDSALLMGVMDEFGMLKYGEVYLAINPDPASELPRTITGGVVVAKNPCFHPGDVRRFKAVDKPQLRHLVNVVVFPSRGSRPHPNECSGSDLDGDQYYITWHAGLVFKGPNQAPMDFTSRPPRLIPDMQAEVSLADIADFLVDFAQNDLLGVIANTHLATADASAQGARCKKCLQLAQLHSDAVDFPKTGRPINFPRELRVQTYPDFMMKKDKDVRQSASIIGQLFREIGEVPQPPMLSDLAEEMGEGGWLEPDPDITISGYKAFLPEAQATRIAYEQELIQIMHQYGVVNEFELVSGCISKFARHRRKKGDVKALIMDAVGALRRRFLREFEEKMEKVPNAKARHTAALQCAAAWYKVTYDPDLVRSGRNSSKPGTSLELDAHLLSFPWILVKYLAHLKTHRA